MKTATLLLSISALWGVELRAATVSFSNIPATNVVKATDLLLLDSALGGTNYSTRTLTVSNLANVVAAPVGTVVATGTNAAGMVLTAADDKGTNGVWSDPIWANNGVSTSVSLIETNAQLLIGHRGNFAADAAWLGGNFENTGQAAFWFQLFPTNGYVFSSVNISPAVGFDTNSNPSSIGFQVSSGIASISNSTAMYFAGGAFGIVGDSSSETSNEGTSVGVLGNAGGHSLINIGVVGFGNRSDFGSLNVGVVGTANSFFGDPIIGGYFETWTGGRSGPLWESAVLLLDNRDADVPIIVGRTNNGDKVFLVSADGSIAAGSTNQWKTGDYADGTVGVTVNGTDHKLGPLTTNAPNIAAGSIAAFSSSNVLGAATSAQASNLLSGVFQLITTQVSLTHAGSVLLDLTPLVTQADLSLTGAVTFGSLNLAAGHQYTVFIRNPQATNCPITLPAWQFIGGTPAGNIVTAQKVAVLSINSRGTVDTNVWASYAELP